MRIAVVGSRKGANLNDVQQFLTSLHRRHPEAIVVSGGAAGVDRKAETVWGDLGGKVASWRPRKLDDESWGVELWSLGGSKDGVQTFPEPSFADFTSAVMYRNTLVVHASERVVAFQAERLSKGTMFTCGFAKDQGKPVHVYTPRNRFSQ